MGKITHLTFVDIETTAKNGPETRDDAIVEIAAARVNLSTRKIEHAYETLIRPHGPQAKYVPSLANDSLASVSSAFAWDLGDFHVRGKHFEGADWGKGEHLSRALSILFVEFLREGVTIAGQNPNFDLEHLERDAKDLWITMPKLDYHRIDLCSPAIFLHIAGTIPGLSLRHTAPWAGCMRSGHRAMNDVLNAIDVFWAMYNCFSGAGIPMLSVGYVNRDKPTNPEGPRMTITSGGYNHKIEKVCPVCGEGFGNPNHGIQEIDPPRYKFCDRSTTHMIPLGGLIHE